MNDNNRTVTPANALIRIDEPLEPCEPWHPELQRNVSAENTILRNALVAAHEGLYKVAHSAKSLHEARSIAMTVLGDAP